jgi:hypothetical protein
MVRTLVGQQVKCAAKQPVVRHNDIEKMPARAGEYLLPTPVSITDSHQRLIRSDQRRWGDRVRNVFTVETYPHALLCFQIERLAIS